MRRGDWRRWEDDEREDLRDGMSGNNGLVEMQDGRKGNKGGYLESLDKTHLE
jgi:hypothetical protein